MTREELIAAVEVAVRERGGDPSRPESKFGCPESERTPKSSHRVLRGRRGYATVGDDPEWRFRQRASGHDVIIAYRRASPS